MKNKIIKQILTITIICLFIFVIVGCKEDEQKTPITETNCGNNVCDPVEEKSGACPEDCIEEKTITELELPELTKKQGQGVLYLGMMVHLEGWDNAPTKESAFNTQKESALEFAEIFEQYGAKATFEARPEFVEACENWDDNVLLQLYERGHGIGVHADLGGKAIEKGYTQEEFVDGLTELKISTEELLGHEVRHVSGICSELDWVKAAVESGYEFTTGGVGYCAMSLPEEERPDEYKDCVSPALCHGLIPLEVEDRVHPWRMSTGTNWVTPDPEGGLVFFSSDGRVSCLAEASGECSEHLFTLDDIQAYLDVMEESLEYSTEDEVNILYLSTSIGSSENTEMLAKWLETVQPYVEQGLVEWKTIPEMYDAFVELEG